MCKLKECEVCGKKTKTTSVRNADGRTLVCSVCYVKKPPIRVVSVVVVLFVVLFLTSCCPCRNKTSTNNKEKIRTDVPGSNIILNEIIHKDTVRLPPNKGRYKSTGGGFRRNEGNSSF